MWDIRSPVDATTLRGGGATRLGSVHPTDRPSPLLAWASVDAHPYAAAPAALGLVLAVVLAIFGMPPVSLHGPLHFLGIMDPLCGMTRGVASAMRGDLAKALSYNPASPAVLLGGGVALARWIYGRRSGRWLNVSWRSPTRVAVIAVLVAGLEVNQQLQAERLLG